MLIKYQEFEPTFDDTVFVAFFKFHLRPQNY